MKLFKAARLGAFLAILGVLAAACGDDFSEQDAIDQLVEAGFTAEQAQCTTDRTQAELGKLPENPNDEEATVIAGFLLDCTTGSGTSAPPPATTTGDGSADGASTDGSVGDGMTDQGPDTPPPGTDAELDALWVSCAGGSAESCDELFLVSPVDSVYEEFGFTCGYRAELAICSDILG